MRPSFDLLSFIAGTATGVVCLLAALGLVFAVWLANHWFREQRRVARLSQLTRDVEELENRKQALGLTTPPRLVPLDSMKRANRE